LRNILLVGGNGYIGRGIQRILTEKSGLEAQVIDLPTSLFSLSRKAIKDVDAIFNLAVTAEPEQSAGIGYASESWRTTVDGTVHLLQLCESVDIPLIQFSTREVHSKTFAAEDVVQVGENLRPLKLIPEDVAFAPRSAYGRSKLISEWLCAASPVGYAVRLGTPYSDETPSSGGGLVASVIRTAVLSGAIDLDGGGRQFRDPLHVEDLTALALKVAAQRPGIKVFNAGHGGDNVISLREIALIANPDVEIHTTPGGDLGFAMDTSLAREVLDWSPGVQVRSKIPAYAKAYAGQAANH